MQLKRQIRRLTLLTILLLFAPAARAQTQLTTAEQASLENLRQAHAALMDLLDTQFSTANASECTKVNTAAYTLGQSIGWLLAINVHANNATGAALLAGPRADVVATAWQYLDAAVVLLNGASSTFAGNSYYQTAQSKIAAVDRTLSYANPFPLFPVSSLGTDPENQFGPHGQYETAQLKLWGAYRYSGFGSMGPWMDAITGNQLPPGFETEKVNVVKFLAKFSKRDIDDIWFMSAQIRSDTSFTGYRTDAEELLTGDAKRALSEIHLAYGPGDSIGSTNATAKHNLFLALLNASIIFESGGVPPGTMPKVGMFLRQFGDGWQRLDEWVGHFNVIR